jgi:ubiquinone/menaquinone biosynthesis C-methylase UbiE
MKLTESIDASFSYAGEELELFAQAVRWKGYWSSRLAPFVGTDVLEVGAGIGTNTLLLVSDHQKRWVCLEPDRNLAHHLKSKVEALGNRPAVFDVIIGNIRSLAPESRFDTIIYIDVLEHIESDQEELEGAFRLLSPGGHLIVLSPAHQFLYTAFDHGLGHFRRYSRQTLRAVGPRECAPLRIFYLDSVGFCASLANRLLLKQKLPTIRQIKFWDRYLVRSSLVLDPLLGFNFGKTVVGIWRKSSDQGDPISRLRNRGNC